MAGRIALLAGLFAAPSVLLWLGQRLHQRSPLQRGAFWGGVAGHTLALVVTALASMIPPVWWSGGAAWRDFAVHWSLLIGACAGAAAGAALSRPRH